MAHIIEMPKLSDTMEEGGVAAWLKKEGETIKEGEAFIEIETDKATMEYNSPYEGVLYKILVPAGKTCALNQPIGIIAAKGEKVDVDALLGGKAKPAAAPAAPAKSTAKGESPKSAPAPTPTIQTTAKTAPAKPAGERLRASPLAKKIAAEKGIDITSLSGSGPNGRVILRDLAEGTPATASTGDKAPITARAPIAGDQDIPLTMMRKTIAKRLLEGKNEAPHFYLTRSVNMTQLLAWRQRLNANVGKDDVKVSVNDLIVLATAKALRRHPEVNASWQGQFIRQYGSVHVAVAVALPTGLVTPVVRHTDQLGVKEIARSSKALIEKAKSGQLQPDDYTGGTFTISNLGMMGIEEFTAIINPPQAAILAVGATIPTPCVNDKREVIVQDRMKITMSCDHRVVDGAVGAQFLQTLVSYLEDPLLMLA